jgi:hypothetical protein
MQPVMYAGPRKVQLRNIAVPSPDHALKQQTVTGRLAKSRTRSVSVRLSVSHQLLDTYQEVSLPITPSHDCALEEGLPCRCQVGGHTARSLNWLWPGGHGSTGGNWKPQMAVSAGSGLLPFPCQVSHGAVRRLLGCHSRTQPLQSVLGKAVSLYILSSVTFRSCHEGEVGHSQAAYGRAEPQLWMNA